ncbi:hypothetical protein LJC62_04490, partial [Odoribacter sp. OttesenSCG-928-A06]|nr:hypothetical protein [Odoribacter sp. OttesenSCG-928-A06]
MMKFILSIYDKLISHRGLTLLLLFVILAGCVGMTLRMHYKEDIADFLPQDEQSKKYTNVYNNIGGQNKVVLLFSSDNPDPENELMDCMDSFESHWFETDTIHQIKEMQIRMEESRITSVIEFVYQNIPYFLEREDYTRIDSLLKEPAFIKQRLEERKKLLMLPASGFMNQSLRY